MHDAKRLLNKFTLGVAIVLVVCTFLSKTIAASLMPAVEVINPVRMDFTVSDECDGEAIYDRVYGITCDFPLKVVKVAVASGNTVRAGDVLVEIDSREYHLEMKRKELNILKLKNMIAQSIDSGIIAELTLQLEIEEEELNIYKEIYPTDGKIYADMDGSVYKVNVKPGDTIEPGRALIEMYDSTSASNVIFSLYEIEAVYGIGDKVVLNYTEGNWTIKKETEIAGKTYDAETNTYIYSVPIESEHVRHRQPVSLHITHETPIYDMVVPYSAIISTSDTQNYVFVVNERRGLFGTEHYPKLVWVEIIDSNFQYAAISARNMTASDDIVISSSRYLTSGESVKVTNR